MPLRSAYWNQLIAERQLRNKQNVSFYKDRNRKEYGDYNACNTQKCADHVGLAQGAAHTSTV